MVEKSDIILERHSDSHRYFIKDRFFPSVSEILAIGMPKHPKLLQFFKKNSARKIAKTSADTADFGTRCHSAFESLLLGHDLNQTYSASETDVINQFLLWKSFFEPKVISTEDFVAHDGDVRFAGTLDLLAEIKTDKLIQAGLIAGSEKDTLKMVIDFKTSKNIYHSHKVQSRAYQAAVEQMTGEVVDAVAIARFSPAQAFEFELVPDWIGFHHFKAAYSLYKLLLGGDIPDDYESYLALKAQAGFG